MLAASAAADEARADAVRDAIAKFGSDDLSKADLLSKLNAGASARRAFAAGELDAILGELDSQGSINLSGDVITLL